MKLQRLLVTLTVLNFALLAVLLAQLRPVEANTASSVLRGRALEIVDDRGRVRASIQIHAADPDYPMPDGTTGYAETTILRLINPDGKPGVKLAASDQGTGLLLMGEGQGTWVRMGAQGRKSELDLRNKDGPALTIKP